MAPAGINVSRRVHTREVTRIYREPSMREVFGLAAHPTPGANEVPHTSPQRGRHLRR